MPQSIDVKLASDRTIKAIVLVAFPSYRKRTAWLSVFHAGKSINSYWDGGSRDEYAIVRLDTLSRCPMPTVGHPYFDVQAKGAPAGTDNYVTIDHVGNVKLNVLPAGFVLVEAGTFCGKPSTAKIYANREDLAKLLPAGQVA